MDTSQITLQLVQKTPQNARLIMEWRNDEQTRKASFHQEVKEWSHFFNEFVSSYFDFPDLPPFFLTDETEKIGFIQLKPIDDFENLGRSSCEISLHIRSDKRGMGFGKKGIFLAVDYAKHQGYDVVFADTRPDNTISKDAFLKSGFKALGKATRFIPDLQQRVLIERFVFEINKHQEKGVFVIAEAGSNWRVGSKQRDFSMAKVLIDKAVEAGADAVKFQVFKAKSVYAKNAGPADYLSENGEDSSMESLFKDLEMPDYFIPQLFDYCQQVGIEFMASTFSVQDFSLIDPYVKRHKIASYEITHLRLLQQAALSQKPLILSTGAANLEEINWAVNFFLKNGGQDLSLLQCTAKYPASVKSLNLRSIAFLKKKFGVKVGLSDHSRHHLYAPVAAVALGAKVIEKHYTLDNALPGPDHSFAITAHELKEMVMAIRETENMLGVENKEVSPEEEELRSFASRAIQANEDIHKGDTFVEGKNFDVLRPGNNVKGVHPMFVEEIQGKVSKNDIKCGVGLQQGDW